MNTLVTIGLVYSIAGLIVVFGSVFLISRIERRTFGSQFKEIYKFLKGEGIT